jgi:hypothetical protein
MFAFLGQVLRGASHRRISAGIRDYLVAVFGYGLRVEAYAGLLTDSYPPFRLTA